MKSSNEGQLSQCDQALVAPAPAGCPKRWRLASSCGRAEERDWINICKAVGLLQLARTRHVSSATCATAQLMPRQGKQSAAPHPAAHRMVSTVAASVRDSSSGRLPIWELTAATQSLCMVCMDRAEGTCLVREVLERGENRAFCFYRRHHEHPTPGAQQQQLRTGSHPPAALAPLPAAPCSGRAQTGRGRSCAAAPARKSGCPCERRTERVGCR